MGTDIHSVFQKRTENGWEDVGTNYDEPRHYVLFAWIGDVRNGYGFAGIKTHNKIVPLSSGRGLPEDFQHTVEDWEYCHGDKWLGDHSHSWLTADEILNATPPKIIRSGVITIEQYNKWDGGEPEGGWCGGISGPAVVLVESESEIDNKTTHIRVSWEEDTKEYFEYFINEVKRLKDLHGEVRFVFGFDS